MPFLLGVEPSLAARKRKKMDKESRQTLSHRWYMQKLERHPLGSVYCVSFPFLAKLGLKVTVNSIRYGMQLQMAPVSATVHNALRIACMLCSLRSFSQIKLESLLRKRGTCRSTSSWQIVIKSDSKTRFPLSARRKFNTIDPLWLNFSSRHSLGVLVTLRVELTIKRITVTAAR